MRYPGLNINLFLDRAVDQGSKINSIVLYTSRMSEIYNGDNPVASLKPGFEIGTPYKLGPSDDLTALFSRNTDSGLLPDAQWEALVYYANLPIKIIRGIANSVEIWVVPTDPKADSAAYRGYFNELAQNPQVPLSIVLFQQNINWPASIGNNGNQFMETRDYLKALPELHKVGWGFLAFLNTSTKPYMLSIPTDGVFDGTATPPSSDILGVAYNFQLRSAGWSDISTSTLEVEALRAFLDGQPDPQQGFASIWSGAAYVPPPQDVVSATSVIFSGSEAWTLITQADSADNLGFENQQEIDTLIKDHPDWYGANLVDSSIFAAAWMIRLNQSNLGYYSPAANEILLGYEVPKAFRLTLKEGEEVLNNGYFNYPWRVKEGWSLWGASTLDSNPGWDMINSRLVLSVLTIRMVEVMRGVQFKPTSPTIDATDLDIVARADQVCSQLVLEGGLVPGAGNAPPYRLIGPEVVDKTLTMQARVCPVGTAELINVDIINTQQP